MRYLEPRDMIARSRFPAVFVASLALALGACAGVRPATVSGEAHVIDGDSMIIESQWVRLRDLDGPVLGTTCLRNGEPYWCGESAKHALAEYVSGRQVTCSIARKLEPGIRYGTCVVGGESIGAWLVRNGWAAARQSSKLGRQQRQAREERLNLWSNDYRGRSFDGGYVVPAYMSHRYPKAPPRDQRHQDLLGLILPDIRLTPDRPREWDMEVELAIDKRGQPRLESIQGTGVPAEVIASLKVVLPKWVYLPPVERCDIRADTTTRQRIVLSLDGGGTALSFSKAQHWLDGRKLPPAAYARPLKRVRLHRSPQVPKRVGGTVVVRFELDEAGIPHRPEILFSFPRGLFDQDAMQAIHLARFEPLPDGPGVSCYRLEY